MKKKIIAVCTLVLLTCFVCEAQQPVVGPTADNAVNPSTKVSTLPAVANAAQPSFTEAHVVPLSTDLAGNLRTLPSQPAVATGTIVASNSTVTANTLGYGVATVTVHGTYSGVNFAFKFSDDGGTTYYATTCTQTAANTQETTSGVLADNTARAWDCSTYGTTQFRIAASAYTSGTATINITLSGHAIEAAPTVALATGANTIGALTANQSVNVAQINAATPLMGAGNTGTGSSRVTIATDQAAIPTHGHGATGSAVPTGATQAGGRGSGAAGAPVLTAPIVCDNWKPISIASSTSAVLVAKVASKNTYICSINLVSATAQNVALIAGTKTTTECDTSTAGLAGGTTAAAGWNLAANGGLTHGTGVGAIMATASTGLDVCIISSSTGQISGTISWAQF